MFFRNLIIFSLPQQFQLTAAALEEKLAAYPLTAPSGLQSSARGWVQIHDELVFARGRFMMIALGVTQKILPAAVINQAANERAEQLEQKQGFKPGRKQMREIKEAVVAEMLPKAFARTTITRALIDVAGSRVIVDASSTGRAEQVIEALRLALGELPALPYATLHSPESAMTQWLTAGAATGGFNIDQDCTLSGLEADKPTVRYTRHELDGVALRTLLKEGKRVIRLGLTWRDRMGFVLHDSHQIKRLHFLDIDKSRDEGQEKDQAEQLDADFALMIGQYTALLNSLTKELGGLNQ